MTPLLKEDKAHTDIRQDGWIDHHMPSVLIPYLKLGRFDRPVGVWLTVLPGLWGLCLGAHAHNGAPYKMLYFTVIFMIGGFAARAAGCVINDLWDRRIDQKVERTAGRPLASGTLKIGQALAFLFFLLCAACAMLVLLPAKAVIVGMIAIIPIAIYPFMKRITFWPQAFLGVTFNLSLPIGWFCFAKELSPLPVLFYLAAIFLTIGYDTIYAFQDIRDDLKVGIKSTAIKFQSHPRIFVGVNYALAVFLLAAAMKGQMIWLAPAACHLAWQLCTWQPLSRANSLTVFKSHVIFQLLILCGLAAIYLLRFF